MKMNMSRFFKYIGQCLRKWSLYSVDVITGTRLWISPHTRIPGMVYIKLKGDVITSRVVVSRSKCSKNPSFMHTDEMYRILTVRQTKFTSRLLKQSTGESISNTFSFVHNNEKIQVSVFLYDLKKIASSKDYGLELQIRKYKMDEINTHWDERRGNENVVKMLYLPLAVKTDEPALRYEAVEFTALLLAKTARFIREGEKSLEEQLKQFDDKVRDDLSGGPLFITGIDHPLLDA